MQATLIKCPQLTHIKTTTTTTTTTKTKTTKKTYP
jgi:hypothetical protein